MDKYIDWDSHYEDREYEDRLAEEEGRKKVIDPALEQENFEMLEKLWEMTK